MSAIGVAENLLKCLVPRLTYLSVPITGGKIYYQLRRALDGRELPKETIKELVIPENQAKADKLARLVAAQKHSDRQCVFNPSKLEMTSWTQEDYMSFWTSFLKTQLPIVILGDGWAYSNGCCEELGVAYSAHLPIYENGSFDRFSELDAALRLQEAISQINAWGMDAPVQIKVLNELRKTVIV